MANIKKAQIKKLIEELHAKRNESSTGPDQKYGQAVNQQIPKGSKQTGRYRPKI